MHNQHQSDIQFSLIVPLSTDKDTFSGKITNICSIMDAHSPNCYEVVAIDGKGDSVPISEWDTIQGDILVIIDGDLSTEPTSLTDVVSAFRDGSDMAFAGQYKGEIKDGDDPVISYFGIRRSSLSKLHKSVEGYQLIIDILGPETIKKLSDAPSEVSDNYILKHLQKLVGKN